MKSVPVALQWGHSVGPTQGNSLFLKPAADSNKLATQTHARSRHLPWSPNLLVKRRDKAECLRPSDTDCGVWTVAFNNTVKDRKHVRGTEQAPDDLSLGAVGVDGLHERGESVAEVVHLPVQAPDVVAGVRSFAYPAGASSAGLREERLKLGDELINLLL
ncbi:hypothetical protein ZIOFF_002409 [Zingiber officinale]|uniref:Uncharacterized protein n=1 Tax=Zingiber officinale TaxID=94328 RepID=A0A8J5HWV9_ZINOF|nr:hypothetical protein ZIOFF_002409 [Zingiber officinale]